MKQKLFKMSVLVYIESKNSKPKKNSAEIISYGRGLADMLSSELIILSFNIENTDALSNYGPDKILNIKNNDLIKFNVQKYTDVIAQVCGSLSINQIIVDMKNDGTLASLQKKWFGQSFVDLLPNEAPTW